MDSRANMAVHARITAVAVRKDIAIIIAMSIIFFPSFFFTFSRPFSDILLSAGIE